MKHLLDCIENELLSTLEGIVIYNGENIMQYPFTDNNIWSPDLLIRWHKHEEQKEPLVLHQVSMDIRACYDQHAFDQLIGFTIESIQAGGLEVLHIRSIPPTVNLDDASV